MKISIVFPVYNEIDNLPPENHFLIEYRNPRKDSLNRILCCPFVIGKKEEF